MRWSVLIASLAVASAQAPPPQPPPLPAVEELRLGAPPPAPAKPVVEKKAEEPEAVLLRYEGEPLRIPYRCTDEDIQTFGMTCSAADPCRIFAELTGVASAGERLFVAGNLHNGSSTMYSLLLASEDGGKTWTEPVERIPSSGLDQVRFFDLANGWVSGHILQALPRDPFFLLTTNGGKSWRRRPVFPDGRIGTVEQFRFDSANSGTLIFDRGQTGESESRFERYETMTGAESWMIREASSRPIEIRGLRLEAAPLFRLQTNAALQAHVVERRQAESWAPVVSFLVDAGECRPSETPLPEPPPPEEAPAPPPSAPPRRK